MATISAIKHIATNQAVAAAAKKPVETAARAFATQAGRSNSSQNSAFDKTKTTLSESKLPNTVGIKAACTAVALTASSGMILSMDHGPNPHTPYM